MVTSTHTTVTTLTTTSIITTIIIIIIIIITVGAGEPERHIVPAPSLLRSGAGTLFG